MRFCFASLFLVCSMHSFVALGFFEEAPAFHSGSEFDKRLAGDWSSGGGNAVVCFHPHIAKEAIEKIQQSEDKTIPDEMINDGAYIKSIEMYDLFEAKLPRGFSNTGGRITPIREDESYYQYAGRLAMRFENAVPGIVNTLMEGRNLLPDSQFRYHAGALKQQNDIGDIALIDKNKCIIQTIAAQRNWSGFVDVYIDERLFNYPTHSAQSKATLVVHEYIYAFSRIHLNHQDSSATRKVVESLISSHPSLTIDYTAKMVFELGYGVQSERSAVPREHTYETHLLFSPMMSYYNLTRALGLAVEEYTNEHVRTLIIEINEFLSSQNLPNFPLSTPLHTVAVTFPSYADSSTDPLAFELHLTRISHMIEKMANDLRDAIIAPSLVQVERNIRDSKYIHEWTMEKVILATDSLFSDLRREMTIYDSRIPHDGGSSIISLSRLPFERLFDKYKNTLSNQYLILDTGDLGQMILP